MNELAFFYQNRAIVGAVDPVLDGYQVRYFSVDQLLQRHFDLNIFKLIILEAPRELRKLHQLTSYIERYSHTGYILIDPDEKVLQYYGAALLARISMESLELLPEVIEAYCNSVTPRSDLAIFEMATILQMISTEQKTLGLKVIARGEIGFVVFVSGTPVFGKVDSFPDQYYGPEAIYRMLLWEGVDYQVIRDISEYPRNINTSMTNLLMDAMVYQDELKQSGEEPLSRDHSLQNHFHVFEKFEGLKGILIYDLEGNCIAAIKRKEGLDINLVGQQMGNLLKGSEKLAVQYQLDNINSIQIVTDEAIILLERYSEFNLLAFFDLKANIVMAKLLFRKISDVF